MKAEHKEKMMLLMEQGLPLKVCNICGFEAMTADDLELMQSTGNNKGRAFLSRKNKCKKCAASEFQEWSKDNKKYIKEKARRHLVKKNFGISMEEYNEKMSTSIVCEICGSDYKLRYDHNHDTGEFRGVLCTKCNSGLGMLGDNPKHIAKALEYLLERGHYGKC